MEQTFSLEIQAGKFQISEDEIRESIPESVLAKIKESDPTPEFVAYIVGQEGIATPRILDGDSKPIVLMKEKIGELVQAIKSGIKLYKNHNKDNSTKNREEYGEVVSSIERTVNGKRSAIAIAYVPKSKVQAVKKMDVLSLEGVLSMIDQGAQKLVDAVVSITGLAIGSSTDWEPAFNGARQIAMIQALNKQDEPNMSETQKTNPLSFHDVKAFKEERKIFPSQLYSPEEVFGKAVKDSKGNIRFVGGDALFVEQAENFVKHLIEERTQELTNKVQELETTLGTVNTKKQEYFSKAIKSEWFPALTQKAKDKKFTENALKLLDLELSEVNIPEDEKEREALGEKLLEKVAQKHEKLFGGTKTENQETNPPPDNGGEAPGKNPFLIEEE